MYYNVQIGKRNMTFTYFSEKDIELGTYCNVELGKNIEKGVIVSKMKEFSSEYAIKEILEVLDEKLDENLFKLIKWMHEYYLEPYGNLIYLIEKKEYVPKKEIKEKEIKVEEYKVSLNSEQEKVVNDIETSEKKVHLINGVTGSGKTEVYIRLIKDALKKEGSSIILVPEITLTAQLSKKLENIFGNKLVIWHSKLQNKGKAYKQLEEGTKKIILGTRSAIFCKIKNLRYIIIDEEHENTYKQEEAPRYHVKNVAIKRALLENAKLVLVSATPSFETMFQVENGNIVEHKLESRYKDAKLPEFHFIDVTNEKNILTDTLINKINEKISKNEQVILLLNRKAYSIFVKCINCNKTQECSQCSTSLSYYKKGFFKCNQCSTTYKYTGKCKYCGSEALKKLGIGTEKIEENLKEIFDEDRILRMDSDSMNTNKKINEAYKDFLDKKYDILIGTQILAKGFHFPNVTLVGIINADQMLSYPDYRAYERAYQLITQASGRAGRGEKKGEVIIQSYNTNLDLLDAIANNDYKLIYNSQMEMRKALFYPPYSKNIKILITDTNENRLDKVSKELYLEVIQRLSDFSDRIYPVSNAFIYKIAKRYRKNINIIYDRKNEIKIKNILRGIVLNKKISGTKILIDVDPTSML